MGRSATTDSGFTPISYDIAIEPNLHSFMFKGKVSIAVELKKSANRITLNSKELKIKSVTSTFAKREKCKVIENSSNEEIEILFKDKINGRGVLYIEYEGYHNDNIYGFSRYEHMKNGRKEYVVSTRLEPTGARAVFPCIDNPASRAVFNITLVVDKNLEALSNMPVKSRKVSKDKITIAFQQTPVMPTYLLFMAAGEFKYLESNVEGHLIRVVTAPGMTRKTKVALGYANEMIKFYENYLGVKYPFPKLDMVAIPGYGRNTMEHLGVVSFGELDMLADAHSSPELKLEIKRAIAHEFAHQWFGNLVTVMNWGDIWLSEGVATFLSSKALAEELSENVQESLEVDSSSYTHPLSTGPRSYENPALLFDYITYVKGAALLVMLENLMGSKNFREGLHRYLESFAEKGASTQDFSDAMSTAMHAPKKSYAVRKFIGQWATESGYPIIRVSKEGNSLLLKQYLFTLARNRKMKAPRITPINLYDGKREWHIVMDDFVMHVGPIGEWAKLNYGQKTLCRVEYAPNMLSEIGKQVRLGNISTIDVKGLLDDIFILVRSGRVSLNESLTFISSYCQNLGLDIDRFLLKQLEWAYAMTHDAQSVRNKIKRMIILTASRVLSRTLLYPKKHDSLSVTQARNIAFDALGVVGDPKVVSMARLMLNRKLSGKRIDKGMMPYFYKAVARTGNFHEYKKFISMRKNASLDEDEYLLAAIASFTNRKVVQMALDYLISDEVPNSAHLIRFVASTPRSCSEVVWPWMKLRWSDLSKKYNSVSLEDILSSLWMVSDQRTKNDIKRFFSERDLCSIGMEGVLKRILETIDANVRFIHRNSIP